MATLTIRDLPDDVRDRLRIRAAHHGRSMEAEVRALLSSAVHDPQPEDDFGLGGRIRARFAEIGFVEPDELVLPDRSSRPRYATFDE